MLAQEFNNFAGEQNFVLLVISLLPKSGGTAIQDMVTMHQQPCFA